MSAAMPGPETARSFVDDLRRWAKHMADKGHEQSMAQLKRIEAAAEDLMIAAEDAIEDKRDGA